MTTLREAHHLLDSAKPSQVNSVFFNLPKDVQKDRFLIQSAFKNNPNFGHDLDSEQLEDYELSQLFVELAPNYKIAREIYQKLSPLRQKNENILYSMVDHGNLEVFDKGAPGEPFTDDFCFMLSACFVRTGAYEKASPVVQQEIQTFNNYATKKSSNNQLDWHAMSDYMYKKTSKLPRDYTRNSALRDAYFAILNFELAKAKTHEPYKSNNEGFFARIRGKHQRDRAIYIDCFKKCGHSILKADDKMKNDFDYALAAVTQNVHVIQCLNPVITQNREIAIAVAQSADFSLKHLDLKFRDDKEIVLLACQKSPLNYDYASPRLKEDQEICMICVASKPRQYLALSEASKRDFRIMLATLEAQNQRYKTYLYDQELFNAIKKNIAGEHRETVFGLYQALDDTDENFSDVIEKQRFTIEPEYLQKFILPALEILANKQLHQELKRAYINRKIETTAHAPVEQPLSTTTAPPEPAAETLATAAVLVTPPPVVVKKLSSRRI